jgi:hypothetical protein
LFIEPGYLWEKGYVESFIGKFKDELLNREIFDTFLRSLLAAAGRSGKQATDNGFASHIFS